MIKIEKVSVYGLEEAIRGMRNPMNSWDQSDSGVACTMDKLGDCFNDDYINCDNCHTFKIGPNDYSLMTKLAAGGPVHAKYRRMITVYVDVTAPLYWWKEFDTYKVGTVANSCSTMHRIADKEFTLEDFSCEHLDSDEGAVYVDTGDSFIDWEDSSLDIMKNIVICLNYHRNKYLKTKNKKYWWQMIQLLPSSYNQKRTVMLNYEVLAGIYPMRKNHKLDEWRKFCRWIDSLPYSEIIIGGEVTNICRQDGKVVATLINAKQYSE